MSMGNDMICQTWCMMIRAFREVYFGNAKVVLSTNVCDIRYCLLAALNVDKRPRLNLYLFFSFMLDKCRADSETKI